MAAKTLWRDCEPVTKDVTAQVRRKELSWRDDEGAPRSNQERTHEHWMLEDILADTETARKARREGFALVAACAAVYATVILMGMAKLWGWY